MELRMNFTSFIKIKDASRINDICGEIFYVVNTNNELFVEAKKACTVLFFIYDDLQHNCKADCNFHQILLDSLSSLYLNKVIELKIDGEENINSPMKELVVC